MIMVSWCCDNAVLTWDAFVDGINLGFSSGLTWDSLMLFVATHFYTFTFSVPPSVFLSNLD